MEYSITEASRMTYMTSSAIRYYEQLGILPEIKRTEGGHRCFIDSDIKRLNIINCLKKTGMSLKDIQNCLCKCDNKVSSIDERLKIFTLHKQHILNEIKELKAYLIEVDEKITILQEKKSKAVDN
ncbi:MerR family transcriptional regulator [Clostridium sp. JNZ X4-2]